ncbi:MAG: leucine-rich repeat domain-containing protein [Clostridia bacterium]|nr:leucine-rich repeat domain-containing protein [Clostridia bacterium]
MKKILCLILALGILASAMSAVCLTASAEEYVNIPDKGLIIALQDTNIDDEGPGGVSDGKFTAAQLAKLTYLEIGRGEAVKSLEGLQYCTNLETLIASANPIESLEPLRGLPKLRYVSIENYDIEDEYGSKEDGFEYSYDVLDGYKYITDISPLGECPALESVALSGNRISDISPLANATKLEGLYINSNYITDISPLANLSNLTELDLCENNIHDISALNGLSNLEYLDIEDNFIGDPSPLLGLTGLKDGYFDGNYFDMDNLSVAATFDKVAETITKNSGRQYKVSLENLGNPVKTATGLTGESAADGIKLTWTNSAQATGRKVDATQIFRIENGSNVLIGTLEGDGTEYTDTTAEVGKEYIYSVRTCVANDGNYVTSAKSATVTVTREASSDVMLGDIDGSGSVTTADALLALKASVGITKLNAEQMKAAEVDGEPGITTSDALNILKYCVGIIKKFPIEG